MVDVNKPTTTSSSSTTIQCEVLITQEDHEGKEFSRPGTCMSHPHSQLVPGQVIIGGEFLEEAGVIEVSVLDEDLFWC